MKILRQHWPVISAIIALWLVLLVLLRVSLGQNQGHFVYALDDSYIQIAIARNFARFGVWGITRYGFTSASSSILWPLVLSAIYLPFGVREIAPFILNILCATLVVIVADRILRETPLAAVSRFVWLLAITFLAPLPALVFAGMEHTAQILFDVLFVFVSAAALGKPRFSSRDRSSLMLLLLAPLVTSIRYEGLFVVLVVCTLFVTRRRTLFALAVGLCALAPVAIFGLISVMRGAAFVPNSLLLKGLMPMEAPGLLAVIAQKLIVAPHLPLLMALALCLYLFGSGRSREKWDQDLCLLLIFLGSAFVHLVLAGVGWFYRYEAYLVVLGILVNARLLRRALLAWTDRERRRRLSLAIPVVVTAVLLNLTAFVMVRRGVRSLRETPQATTNIYEQQYQMATFVRDYYQGTSVLANDVGAINVLADVNCVDIWGLANTAVARAKLANTYTSEMVDEMAQASRARIAIVYDEWLDPYGGVPSHWIKVGEWRITNNVICASDKLSFYAVDAAEIGELRASLTAFAPRLPPSVIKKTLGEFLFLPFGTRLDLTLRDADSYLIQGWSANDGTVRWSDKRTAFIGFELNETAACTLRIKLTPFLVPGKLETQRMNVSLNDQRVATLSLKGPGEYSVTLPGCAVRDKKVIELEFPDAASPASLGLNTDARLFGINVEWIEVIPAVEVDRRFAQRPSAGR